MGTENLILQCGLEEQIVLGVGLIIGFLMSTLVWVLFAWDPKLKRGEER